MTQLNKLSKKPSKRLRISAKPGDLLVIEAIDLTTKDDVWLPVSQAASETPMVVHVAGFYLGHDERAVRLTSMLTPTDQHAGPIVVVPLGAITRCTKVPK